MSETSPAETERATLGSGSDGRTRLFEGAPKTIQLTLDAGESIPAHKHPGREIVFLLRSGAVDLTLGDETLSLSPGDIVRFDGDQDISPAATADSEALLVLAASSK
ncbi:cupin domain-containing protein [Haloarcula sp. CBA1130]|uniref:cupin domain-containing protein n=1 Tax=unclassified Haloarcula TaxID=2624677 RepID=UPI0012456266|nr:MULTISPECIES: cupin domain-containing protein [unclassified Haloarcula]KAA9398105.1 cupin domain-containing protein [Haloarcula sp. CBA1129]KAA9402207.1 cupin domain-containing protein [Haloarcula sp. CBA1130]